MKIMVGLYHLKYFRWYRSQYSMHSPGGPLQVYSGCGSSLYELLVKWNMLHIDALFWLFLLLLLMMMPCWIVFNPRLFSTFSPLLGWIWNDTGACPGLQATAAHVHLKLTAPLGIWMFHSVYTPHANYVHWLIGQINPEDLSNKPADHTTLCSLMTDITPAMTKLIICCERGSG